MNVADVQIGLEHYLCMRGKHQDLRALSAVPPAEYHEMCIAYRMHAGLVIMVHGANLTLSGEERQRIGSCSPWLRHMTHEGPHCDSADVLFTTPDVRYSHGLHIRQCLTCCKVLQ